MKTMTNIVELYDNHKIKGDDIYEISVRDVVRVFKAHQRALNERTSLEARIASLELELAFRRQPERVVYG